MVSLSKQSFQAVILTALFLSCCLFLIPCVRAAQEVYLCRKEETSFPCIPFPELLCGIGFNKDTDQFVKTTGQGHCQTCKTQYTRFTAPEKCENYPDDAIFCHPRMAMNGLPCSSELKPVCGVDYSRRQFTCHNSCTACSSKDIVYYVNGACELKNLRI